MTKHRLSKFILLCTVIFGLIVTLQFWFKIKPTYIYKNYYLIIGLIVTTAIGTLLNLIIRWFRFTLYLRHNQVRIPAKFSVKFYFASQILLPIPLYLGELFRNLILSNRTELDRSTALKIWLIERSFDVFAIFFLLTITLFWGNIILLISFFFIGCIISLNLLWSKHRRDLIITTVLAFVTSVFAWYLPILALWVTFNSLGAYISFRLAIQIFLTSALLGGFSSIPLGIGVSGTVAIILSQAGGINLQVAVIVISIFRIGTSWFALIIGAIAIFIWSKELRVKLFSDDLQGHFNDIAPYYADIIPIHMRNRLLDRKINEMKNHLQCFETSNKPLNGLDLGCGQGWYTHHLAQLNYEMTASDMAHQQVLQAKHNLKSVNKHTKLVVADGRYLPFKSNSFDFITAINVIHHITPLEKQLETFNEIVRVLQPGGKFFLQEINTRNLIFKFYVGYIFPLLKEIDDGSELWIKPNHLPQIVGSSWLKQVSYFYFLPDFTPENIMKKLSRIETMFEQSRFRIYSSHFMAVLVKNNSVTVADKKLT